MRARGLLIATALVSSILGAVVAYLVLTVPNDLESAALMKQAKRAIDAGQNERARDALSKIVQQYPRTDAAAAATVALVRLADADRARLARDVAALRSEVESQKAQLGTVSHTVGEIKSAPPPQPAAAPAPPPARKKKTVHHTKHRKRRR